MASRPYQEMPPPVSTLVLEFEDTFGADVVEEFELAAEVAANDFIDVWSKDLTMQGLKIARAELGDVFGDFKAGLRTCTPETEKQFARDWATDNLYVAGLALALERAIANDRFPEARLEETPAPSSKVPDYTEEARGWSRDELRAIIADDMAYEGLPAAAERLPELYSRRGRVRETIEHLEIRILVSDYFDEDPQARAQSEALERWDDALERVDEELRFVKAALVEVDPETLDKAARFRAAQQEWERRGPETGAPDLSQEVPEPAGYDAGSG